MTSTYDFWLSALELAGDYGILGRAQLASLGVHEDEPQPGFWRVPPPKRRLSDNQDMDESWVAIWPQGDGLAAVWNGEPTDPCSAWLWCCKTPVSEERWRRMERDNFGRPRVGLFAQKSA